MKKKEERKSIRRNVNEVINQPEEESDTASFGNLSKNLKYNLQMMNP